MVTNHWGFSRYLADFRHLVLQQWVLKTKPKIITKKNRRFDSSKRRRNAGSADIRGGASARFQVRDHLSFELSGGMPGYAGCLKRSLVRD
jgi:hypothetical protein